MSDEKIIIKIVDVTGISIGGKRTALSLGCSPVDDKTLEKINNLKGRYIQIKEVEND